MEAPFLVERLARFSGWVHKDRSVTEAFGSQRISSLASPLRRSSLEEPNPVK